MKPIPIGVDNFKRIIEDKYYYVDKSKAIEDLINSKANVILYTRPRRFGKSLLLSTLDYFFNIEKKEENKSLFDGLYISKSDCMEYFGKYPVIRLDFKDLKGNSFESVLESLKSLMSITYSKFRYLQDSIEEENKIKFTNILLEQGSTEDYKKSLLKLTNYLESYYKEKVIVLIDEYDTPINEGYIKGFYDEIMDLIQPILSSSLKGNESLKMGILTGVLRVGGQSLFSSFNNLKVYDVMSNNYSEYFGFTLEETKEILKYYNLELTKEVKDYYDGYVFGNVHVCNPWSILNYCSDKILEPYWLSTGSNKLIKKLLSEVSIKEPIEKLLQGDSIDFKYDKSITYESFTDVDNLNNLLNLLLVTGYVTFDRKEESTFSEKTYFKIPNKEVKEDFIRIVDNISYKQRIVTIENYEDFIQSFLSDDKKYIENYLNQKLLSVSYYDNYESFYHGYSLGLFSILLTSNNFIVKSNRETGLRRSDVLIEKVDRTVGVVVEFKLSESESDMETLAREAKEQIKEREYYKELVLDGVKDIKEIVIVFNGKKAIVR
ncbi:MAG: AAA family ATPase [Bacilli bacterium]|nr:AAA family ATPase [Bacilli bacterium]